jgi:hypothetical protein
MTTSHRPSGLARVEAPYPRLPILSHQNRLFTTLLKIDPN